MIVVEINGQRPAQAGLLKTKQILADRTAGDVATFSDLAAADVTVEL
jgi:hypothetical protein